MIAMSLCSVLHTLRRLIFKGFNTVVAGSLPEEVSCHVGDMDASAKVQLMPEYLVVCGWRSIKEVSLLLGQLMSAIPLQNISPTAEQEGYSGGTPLSLITLEQVYCMCGVLGGYQSC